MCSFHAFNTRSQLCLLDASFSTLLNGLVMSFCGVLLSLLFCFISVQLGVWILFALSFYPWNVWVVAQDCSGSPIAAEARAEQQHPKLQNISQAGSKLITHTLIWLVGSCAKLEPNDKISTCVKRKPCLLCMCQLSPLQTSPCNCLPTPLGKAETKTEYQPSVSMVPSDGHWAKPKNPRMSISCSHVLTCKVRLMATGQSRRNGRCQYCAYMFWRGNFVLWRLGKAGKTKDVCLLLIYMFWRIDFGGWAKPKKTRMAVYMFDTSTSSGGHWAKPKKTHGCESGAYMLWCVNFVWWPLGKAENPRISVYSCMFLMRTPFDGDCVKPRKHRISD